METSIREIARTYIKRAKVAQLQLRHLTQQQVDDLAYRCGKAVYDHAELLAQRAVDETGIGNVRDKTIKNRAKAEAIWAEIKDRRTVGIIRRDEQKRMIYYADPVGVVAGVAPCTNPIVTAMFYSMICLKTRNCLVVAPHPKARNATHMTVQLMLDSLAHIGLPTDIIQVLDEPQLSGTESLQLASEVMSQADMIIATGGPKLVDVAYHSGTPAYGVGAGNTPVYIHPSCDVELAIEKVISGRSFDNGIICASEQHLISPEEIKERMVEALAKSGAYLVADADERERLIATLFDAQGHMKAEFIGKPAAYVALRAEIPAPQDCRTLVVPVDAAHIGKDPFSAEKLCPILSWFSVDHYHEGLDIAESLLNYQGKGHSAAIHIDEVTCEADLLAWSARMPVTHIIVNMASATSAGGSRYNWMTPSTTLGCGAYGGTMPMESINLSVKQLINYKAVAMPLATSRIPENVF
jgi:succinate-semialdehyde dehydrogenase